MTPSMQYDVEAALREMLEAPGELTWRSLEETLKRNGLRLVKEAEEVTEADVDAAFGRGVDALLAAIKDDDGYVQMRRAGTGEPEPTFTYDDIEQIAEEAFTE